MFQILKSKKHWGSEEKMNSGFVSFSKDSFDDELIWIASTGSSSRESLESKWVGINQDSLIRSVKNQCKFLNINKSDRILNSLPPSHIAYLASVLRSEVSGAKFIDCFDSNYKWNPLEFCKKMTDERISLASLVPTQIFDLVKLGLKAPSQDHRILLGGGFISDDLLQRAKDLGWVVLRSFGATETCAFIAANSVEAFLRSNFKMKLLDGWEFRKSKEGFLELRSENLFEKYCFWNESTQSAKILTPKKSKDQYWTTEDYVDLSDGDIQILGRGLRFSKRLGENINLDQIESKLKFSLEFDLCVLAKSSEREGAELLVLVEKLDQACLENIKNAVANLNSIERPKFVLEAPILKAENSKYLFGQMQNYLKEQAYLSCLIEL